MRQGWMVLAVMVALAAASPVLADANSAAQAVQAMPGVIDAIPDNGGNLWVTVAPNPGVQWSKYAAMICQVVKPHQARIFLVKIIDKTSVHSKSPKDWRMIGAADCSR